MGQRWRDFWNQGRTPIDCGTGVSRRAFETEEKEKDGRLSEETEGPSAVEGRTYTSSRWAADRAVGVSRSRRLR